jgi:ABC-type polysaccharide/polyol phosphate transport system ATPase subunit
LSFSIRDGERVGIVGRNGAGKSTLLKTICRIYEPSAGKVTVHGRIAPLLEIGAGFHPEFTGRENIYFNGTILGYRKEQLRAIEQEIISFAELEEFIDTPVKYYSTGMYMRLAFSLATTVDPDVLVLDELFAGGDATFVKRGKERMYNMIDRARVMILVSHDQSLLRSLCERFIWLDHGKIVADGDVSVLDQYAAS